MKAIILGLCVLVLSSCSNYQKMLNTKTERENGGKVVTNAIAKLKIQYYGDYDFHAPKSKLFKEVNRAYLKKILRKNKRNVVVAGHTGIEPLFSTIVLSYEEGMVADWSLNIEQMITNNFSAKNFKKWTQQINTESFSVLSYTIGETCYIDYLRSTKKATDRFLFWTPKKYSSFLEKETMEILKTLQKID